MVRSWGLSCRARAAAVMPLHDLQLPKLPSSIAMWMIRRARTRRWHLRASTVAGISQPFAALYSREAFALSGSNDEERNQSPNGIDPSSSKQIATASHGVARTG